VMCTIGMAVLTVGVAVFAHDFSRPIPESRCTAPRWIASVRLVQSRSAVRGDPWTTLKVSCSCLLATP